MNIRRAITEANVCVLTFDREDSGANVFDWETLHEFDGHIAWVLAASGLTGLILTSAKEGIFIAGADLKLLAGGMDETEMRRFIEVGQRLSLQLQRLPIPTVAAIHGACIGGGFELALACDYRIATAERVTRIGLPETSLGIIPAWGGATRLPRLIGLPKALDIILGGKIVPARLALKRGMIDDVVPRDQLLATAEQKIREGKSRPRRRPWVNRRIAAAVIERKAYRALHEKTHGNYPATWKALDVMVQGLQLSLEESLELETDAILEVAPGEACRNLMRIFFLQERARKLKPHSGIARPPAIARTAVIGAGVMGAGIAQWLGARGLPVLLRDVNADALARGMSTIAKLYEQASARHLLTRTEARAGMDRISPAAGDTPLTRVDLVIEAALEELPVKRKIFKDLEAQSRPDTLLATNTSSLSVTEIAAELEHPERAVGIHFFNPVHRMKLVEVIGGGKTAPEVVAAAVAFVQRIGKFPVVVRDRPGFLVNRILMPYLVEAGLLFGEGAAPGDIDDTMLAFGMPMGPLRLLDEVGLDIALHVARVLSAAFPDRMPVPEILEKMCAAGMIGKKSGRGFYLHGKKKGANAGAEALRPGGGNVGRPSRLPLPVARAGSSRHAAPTRRASDLGELEERLVLPMLNEAARCIEEEIAGAPEDVDFAMIMGAGFAPFRGGPLRTIDALGAARVVSRLDHYVKQRLGRFEPCELLRSMAGADDCFYPEPVIEKGTAHAEPAKA